MINYNDRPTQTALQIQSCRISKKRNLKVCFVKNGKVNSNILSFDNVNLAKRVLIKPLSYLW